MDKYLYSIYFKTAGSGVYTWAKVEMEFFKQVRIKSSRSDQKDMIQSHDMYFHIFIPQFNISFFKNFTIFQNEKEKKITKT